MERGAIIKSEKGLIGSPRGRQSIHPVISGIAGVRTLVRRRVATWLLIASRRAALLQDECALGAEPLAAAEEVEAARNEGGGWVQY